MGCYGQFLKRAWLAPCLLFPLVAPAADLPFPTGVFPNGCGPSLVQIGGSSVPALDPAVAKEAWRFVSNDVVREFAERQVANRTGGNPRPGHELYAEAVARVRRNIDNAPVAEAFDAFVQYSEVGRKEFQDNLAIFNDPATHLAKPKLTREETAALSRKAYAFLTRNGTDTANMSHIADHLATLQRLTPILREMRLDPEELQLAMLIHDLGKEFEHTPASYRAFLMSAFPDGGKDFLSQQILPHEFASMAVIERLSQEMGLSREKIDRLKALIAHHNAGYDPGLPGQHFWVAPFAWPTFARRLGTRIPGGIPEVYAAVDNSNVGSPTTVLLTAIDRATSFTLASQEKFAAVLRGQNKWNNAGLAEQIAASSKDVRAEVDNVLGKLKPMPGISATHIGDLASVLNKSFEPDVTRLDSLAKELPLMAKAEGAYADGATLVAQLPPDAAVYKSRTGQWHRVDANGDYFVANAAKDRWEPAVAAEAAGLSGPSRLFRGVIFRDYNYRPRFVHDYAPPGE